MPGKMLFCATVASHLKAFHVPYILMLKERGWQVDVACMRNCDVPCADRQHDVPFERSPYSVKNIRAYRELQALIEENGYDAVHSHTPVGGALARLAARKARKERGLVSIYTSHGFHFCKGFPALGGMLYRTVETVLARWTDLIVTINEEDRISATRLPAKRSVCTHGVGVDMSRFSPPSPERKSELRSANGIGQDWKALVFAGNLCRNKNQAALLRMLSNVRKTERRAHLYLLGSGEDLAALKRLAAELEISDCVHFAGRVDNVYEWLAMADAAVSASLREGLGMNVIEAMAIGLPVVISDIRGHRDIVNEPGKNGFLVPPGDDAGFCEAVLLALSQDGSMSQRAVTRASAFSIENALAEMRAIYADTLGDKW